jgi:hypothetical protein
MPEQYAVDIYGDGALGTYNTLKSVYDELRAFGEAEKPVLIQETYYDDKITAAEIMRAKECLGLKVRAIMQWQIVRGDISTRISPQAVPPSSYSYATAPSSPSCQ